MNAHTTAPINPQTNTPFDLPAYLKFIPPTLLKTLWEQAEAVASLPGLRIAPGLQTAFPSIENAEALRLVLQVYAQVREELNALLVQRETDRALIDAYTQALTQKNADLAWTSPDYQTVIGMKDGNGRVVIGPLPGALQEPCEPVDVPPYLEGEQVTLFGPPDSARMAINAMGALHRKLPNEPAIVQALLDASGQVPRWGADNEDSKTPLMSQLLQASLNLQACFEGTLAFDDPRTGKQYRLPDTGRSHPIKRIPGLALPDGSHLLDGNPLPLHLYDFVMHMLLNWRRPEALVFYIPKLETDAEARYLKRMIETTERLLKARHPEYALHTVKLLIVFENPRAIFRVREIARALSPYFLGGSLGWHDFLASTARLFKHDPNYRIPVKADPYIVINNIKESHRIMVRDLSPFGALRIGGMYGVLYEEGNARSFQLSVAGFARDVVVQLSRGLDGFWVAHPDFVRIGLALVQAWRQRQHDAADRSLEALLHGLITDEQELKNLLGVLSGPDAPGLSPDSPLYLRGVLAADVGMSSVIANHDTEEVRYNLFQALQYLADWLSGNGCVALPAQLTDSRGEKVFVRVMDDLATTERSRWEVWAELHHGRIAAEQFEALLTETARFIQAGKDTPQQRIQVRWQGETARWYPIAVRLLRQLIASNDPVEFVTELLLPFTFDAIRMAPDPWLAAQTLCPGHYSA